APLAVANGDDNSDSIQETLDDSVKFVLTVARRAVLAGDDFMAQLDVTSTKTQLHKFRLSLQARTTEHTAEGEDILGPVESVASIQDTSLEDKLLEHLTINDTNRNSKEVSRLVSLAVPLDATASVETVAFGYENDYFPQCDDVLVA
ncbi:hypothetical protein HDU99_008318, partial [Rhizoclosmatium hyalinum]